MDAMMLQVLGYDDGPPIMEQPSDYPWWRKDMEECLYYMGLKAAISPEVPGWDVPDEMDLEARAVFEEALEYMDEKILGKIRGCKTAREIWTKLERMYMRKTPFEACEMRKKLYAYKIDTLEDVPKMIIEFEKLVASLKLIGESIPPESDLLHIIKSSLPKEYKKYLVGSKGKHMRKDSWHDLCTHVLKRADKILTNRLLWKLRENEKAGKCLHPIIL